MTTGDSRRAYEWLSIGLQTPPDFTAVSSARSQWRHQRLHMALLAEQQPPQMTMTHYFAIATTMTDGLRNLIVSSMIAGITLNVTVVSRCVGGC